MGVDDLRSSLSIDGTELLFEDLNDIKLVLKSVLDHSSPPKKVNLMLTV